VDGFQIGGSSEGPHQPLSIIPQGPTILRDPLPVAD
jgi:hypothetical protein